MLRMCFRFIIRFLDDILNLTQTKSFMCDLKETSINDQKVNAKNIVPIRNQFKILFITQ